MNQAVRTVLSLTAMAVISFGLLWGSDRLTRVLTEQQQSAEVAAIFGELLSADRYQPVTDEFPAGVAAVYRALDESGNTVGYGLSVSAAGFGGPVEIHSAFSADGTRLQGIRVGQHRETAGYGARIESALFTDQFTDIEPPVRLAAQSVVWRDGVYRAVSQTPEHGFTDTVELTVRDGEIVTVSWDGVNDAGESKKALSKAGQYVMSETGLPWHRQAEIMEQTLLYTQDPTKILYDAETGRSDAYSGATIRISPFVILAAQALEGAGTDAGGSGTAVDGISGATITSEAVIKAVNLAAETAASLAAG